MRKAGKLHISKSGKALEIIDEHRSTGNYYFYASLSRVKEVIEGGRVECDIALLVAKGRKNI